MTIYIYNSQSMSYVFDNSSLFMSKWNRVVNLRNMMEKAKPLATNSIRLGVNKIKNHHNKTK